MSLVWSRTQAIRFIGAMDAALSSSILTAQTRALLQADRDGAAAYLRYLETVAELKPPAAP